jgi:hypothetical protein
MMDSGEATPLFLGTMKLPLLTDLFRLLPSHRDSLFLESSTPPSSSGSISSKPTLDSPSPGPSTIGGSAPVPSASTSVLHGERKGSIEEVKKFETDVGDEPGPGAEGDDVRRDAGKGRDREGDTEEGDATGEAHGQQGEGEERDGSQAAAYNEETGEINVSP